MARGIGEVPTVLKIDDPQLRTLLVNMREQLVNLRASQSPLPVPTNPKVTPIAFANLIEWTRVTNADYYEVLWNATPELKTATVQAVGDSQRWVDNVGQVGVKRYYWVRARRYTGSRSAETQSLSGITLASAAGVNPLPPPPPGHIQVLDAGTGRKIYYIPVTGGRQNQR